MIFYSTATHRNIVSPPGLGPEQEDGQAGEADGAQEAVAAAGLLERGGHVAHLARAAAQRVPAHRAVPAAAAHVLLPSVRHCQMFFCLSATSNLSISSHLF